MFLEIQVQFYSVLHRDEIQDQKRGDFEGCNVQHSRDQFQIISMSPLARALVRREPGVIIHRSFFLDNLQKNRAFFNAVVKNNARVRFGDGRY